MMPTLLLETKWKVFFVLTLWSNFTVWLLLPLCTTLLSVLHRSGWCVFCSPQTDKELGTGKTRLKWAAWLRADTVPGCRQNWACGTWKDSHFEIKDGRCWGPRGSLFSEHCSLLVFGDYFQSADLNSWIRAQGSCFQIKLSVGLEQLVENGSRPFQRKEDKTCPTIPCSWGSSEVEGYRTSFPSLPLM